MEDQTQGQEMGGESAIEAPSKVVINGQEYDSSAAQELIGLGQRTREYEQKWNTSLDKVWPEYGKSQQTLRSVQGELADARAQLSQFQTKKDAGTETNGDVEQAREAARKLGFVLNEDLEKSGYIRQDQLAEHYKKFRDEERSVEQILSTAEKLEKEIDGTDGRPKFNKRAILPYAQAYGISDLKAAYDDMHSDVLKSWQESQIAAQKKPGLKTLPASSPGNKSPKSVSPTEDNVKDLLREKLWGSN